MSVLPAFLLSEITIRESGVGSPISLDDHAGRTLIVTLGITRIIEQESIDVSIWGSADGSTWSPRPVATFPQKFYCGTYQVLLDLSDQPDVKFLRAKWQANRWGKGDPRPLFTVYMFVQESRRQALAMGA